jgi:hypothetical protein
MNFDKNWAIFHKVWSPCKYRSNNVMLKLIKWLTRAEATFVKGPVSQSLPSLLISNGRKAVSGVQQWLQSSIFKLTVVQLA